MSLANKPVHPTPANLMGECEEGTITMAHSAGMTLREHYAGLLFQDAICLDYPKAEMNVAKSAAKAVAMADALIEALNNG